MQRPSTRLIEQFSLVKVFQTNNIGAIFNLQQSNEHASCGDGNEPSSGFSYLPEIWMDSNIYYYNFGWPDMSTPGFQTMLDIVQVMDYTLKKDTKVAIHCHAGLGRTGLTIACYYIYAENIARLVMINCKRLSYISHSQ